MALVNTAYVFARQGWRVLMVDFDLEAPGMTHFFSEAIRRRPMRVSRDALDLLLHAKASLKPAFKEGNELSGPPESLAEYVVPVPLPELNHSDGTQTPYTGGRLDLLPATLQPGVKESGEPSTDYLQRMDELNLSMIFGAGGPGHQFGNHVRSYFLGARFDAPGDVLFTMRERVKATYDVVLIDSRTGLNEVSGLSVGPLCDALVICCGLNGQNIEGTRYFMDRAGLLQQDLAKPYIVAAGPVPLWHTTESENRIKNLRAELRTQAIFEIPYHPKAALQETVFVTEEPRDPISRAYEALSHGIVEQLSGKQTEIEALKALSRESLDSGPTRREVASAVAKRLSLFRLWPNDFRLDTSLCSFPSAHTIASIAQWSEIDRSRTNADAAVSTAVAAYRLDSDDPFKRAWQLINHGSSKLTNVLAIRLLYFQLLVRRSFPAVPVLETVRAILTKPQDERSPRASNLLLDAYVTHLLSRRYAPRGTAGLSFGAAQQRFDRIMMEYGYLWVQGGEPNPSSAQDWAKVFPKAVTALTLRKIGKREQEYLSAILKSAPAMLKARLESRNLGRSWHRRQLFAGQFYYERAYFDEAGFPVGLWPELLLAAATAVVKGPASVQQVVDWLYLARVSYGYAWRVMIDWAHLESVRDEPVFRKFLTEEDELVEQIESSIDRGVYPL